jgi:hypothetical protein
MHYIWILEIPSVGFADCARHGEISRATKATGFHDWKASSLGR